ncbi:hypothetical protein BGZ73_003505 [Actinomortierella ambigua]|nr:hypothetical protein BGZ73_003505 [Actinomortierella ambigua]
MTLPTQPTLAPSTPMMVAPVFRKDKSATEEFSRQFTTIYETDRSDCMPAETDMTECQAQLIALLTSPLLTDLHQSPPFSPTAMESPMMATKNEPSDDLTDLFNLTIDDILDQSISSPISMDASDFEGEQQRFQEFVFLQNYPFAEEAVDTVLLYGKQSTTFTPSSYPSPSETIESPGTPSLDWTRSPSPSPSLASPVTETLPKFEPYPTAASPSSLRRASISSTCSTSSACSSVGPIKSRARNQSRRSSSKANSSPKTKQNKDNSTSQAHMTPRRRHRAVPATTLVTEPGLKMVRNKDGSITVVNPETQETSYRCSLCPAERFGRIHDYKRHQLSKHQERVWPCDFCHRPFVRRDALLRHYAVKAGRDDNVHPTESQKDLLAEARARAKLIG